MRAARILLVFAFLAFLAWDFDRLYNGNNASSRIAGWLVLAAVIGVWAAAWALGILGLV